MPIHPLEDTRGGKAPWISESAGKRAAAVAACVAGPRTTRRSRGARGQAGVRGGDLFVPSRGRRRRGGRRDRTGRRRSRLVADVSTVAGRRPGSSARPKLRWEAIDILVANVGGPPAGDFEHTEIDQYLEAFKLNCLSSIAMCYEVVPEMRAQKWGRVVAITSLAVRQPMAGLILSNTRARGSPVS